MYAPLIKIVEAIGLPAAMKVVDNFGGTRIYLPLRENMGEDNEIAKAIGIEAALKFAEAWDFDRDPDRHVEIPLARPQLRVLMKDEILRDSEHMTERQLARKYKTTQRTIRRIRAESDEPRARQPGLF
jgi:Mor family transcriptional regulator